MRKQWITARGLKIAVRAGYVLLPLALAASPALAQQPDPNLPPDYGSVELMPGQALEPYTMMVNAGGEVDAWLAAEDCFGWVGAAPDVNLDFGAGGSRLVIGAYSEADTTIAINAPDGSWHCNDDYAGLNPGVAFDDPAPGRYGIWIGAFDGEPAAQLVITETEMEGVAPAPDFTLQPVHRTVTLEAGFTPDPHVLNVVAGGPADAYRVSDTCSGRVTEAATVELVYTARPGTPLALGARSQGDTTLAVSAPDGAWYCNDDLVGLDPGIVFDDPESGLYHIWVGTYIDTVEAELVISGAATAVLGSPPDLELEPIHGTITLAAGFGPDPHVTGVVAGGHADPSQVSPMCTGRVTEAPTLDLIYEATAGVPLVIGARSDSDTTIVVNAPNGEWYCNDDFVGLDPAVVFDQPESGLYDIWVGSFVGAEVDADLLISAAPPEAPEEIAPDPAAAPVHGSVTLAAGFAPSPHVTDVVAGGPADAWLASPECAGLMSVEPTLGLDYTPAEGVSLTIAARSENDTTLLIGAPDGGWHCNDDFAGLDPAVVFDAPQAGSYDIWVGAFSGETDAELLISEGGGSSGGGTGPQGGGLFGGDAGEGDAGAVDDAGESDAGAEGGGLFRGGSDPGDDDSQRR